MKRATFVLFFIVGFFFFGLTPKAEAADFYINADCTNNGDGSSWSCAGAPSGSGSFNAIPADGSCVFNGYTWVRGVAYWIAGSDSVYTSGACFRNITGSGRITFKKASVANHGTNTGWLDSYGTKQAVTGLMVLWASDITIDGSYRSTPESGYGLKVQAISQNNIISTRNNIPSTGNILKYLELTHTTYTTAAAHAVNLWGNGNNTIQYVYAHDLSGLCFKGNKDGAYDTSSGFNNLVIEESVCGDVGRSTGISHYELMKDDGMAAGTIIRNNLFYDWGGSTGGIVLSNAQSNWKIYNNIFTERNENSSCGNGVITGLSAGLGWTGIKVYNNTFANINVGCSNIFSSGFGDFSGAGNEVKNNLFYKTTASNVCGGGCTKSKNWFYITPNHTLTGDDISGNANPFTNSTLEDFTLLFGSGPIDAGLDLSVAFTTDKNNLFRPQGSAWDIGAYEYINSPTPTPVPTTSPTPSPSDTPPTVSHISPTSGFTISGSVSVEATASDDTGVTGVQFLLDGIAFMNELTTSPYRITWDTTTATDGSHTLTAIARDTAGNQTTSSGAIVTISNSGGTVSQPVSSPDGSQSDTTGASATTEPSITPTSAKNPGLSESQIQAILSLLSSFGADQSVISAVALSLRGSPSPSSPQSLSFTHNLSLYQKHADVKMLQQFLNTHGFLIATSGPGSPENENTFFGTKTYAALIKFQKSRGLPATGWFGPMTRAIVN